MIYLAFGHLHYYLINYLNRNVYLFNNKFIISNISSYSRHICNLYNSNIIKVDAEIKYILNISHSVYLHTQYLYLPPPNPPLQHPHHHHHPTTPLYSKSPVLSSYIIDVSKFDESIPRIVDFAFLFGYYEPTILILHEPHPTWAGLVVEVVLVINLLCNICTTV